MSFFTSGDILSHRWRCLISQVPQTSLSTFCVLGTGDTKSQADPVPPEAQGFSGRHGRVLERLPQALQSPLCASFPVINDFMLVP